MIIKLYKCYNEKNKLNKELNEELTLDGYLRDSTSIVNPSILFELDNPVGYNYMYIEDFGRYYFINDIISVKTKLWRVDSHVDVLMSFRGPINQLNVILSDSETYMNDNYLSSRTWVNKVKTITDIINFPNGLLDDGEFILITAGGISAI